MRLISTTFPTSDEKRAIDNNFSGTTVVRDTELIRCGGYDHSWAWRGSFQLCLDRKEASPASRSAMLTHLRDSISSGLTIVAPGSAKGQGTLAAAKIDHLTIEEGRPRRSGCPAPAPDPRADAEGSLTLTDSTVPDIKNESAHFRLER